MNRKICVGMLAIPLAILLALGACTSNTQAYTTGNGGVYLLDSGATTLNATTNYRFYVETPDYLSLDADYWNFTIYGELINNGGNAANGTYTVTIYINDGAVNHSYSASLAMKNDVTSKVYSNISIASGSITGYNANDSATFTAKVVLSASTLDIYSGAVVISTNAWEGSINSLLPMVISMAALVFAVALMAKVFDKMPKFGTGKKR